MYSDDISGSYSDSFGSSSFDSGFGFDLITSRLLAVIQAVPSMIDGAPRSFLAVLSKTLHLPLY
jgi:hypothetical protein